MPLLPSAGFNSTSKSPSMINKPEVIECLVRLDDVRFFGFEVLFCPARFCACIGSFAKTTNW